MNQYHDAFRYDFLEHDLALARDELLESGRILELYARPDPAATQCPCCPEFWRHDKLGTNLNRWNFVRHSDKPVISLRTIRGFI